MEKVVVIGCEAALNELLQSTAEKFCTLIKIISMDSISKAPKISRDSKIKAFFINTKLIHYNEIQAVKQLHETCIYYGIPIIYVIANKTREMDVFMQIISCNYIAKPYEQERIDIIFNNIFVNPVMNIPKEDDLKLPLKFKDWTTIIPQKDIVFVEYLNRKIVINTIRESIKYIHMPLKRFKERLSDDFVQIHQSIIINKKFIQSIQRSEQSLKLKGVECQLPIGRSYKQIINNSISDLYNV